MCHGGEARPAVASGGYCLHLLLSFTAAIDRTSNNAHVVSIWYVCNDQLDQTDNSAQSRKRSRDEGSAEASVDYKGFPAMNGYANLNGVTQPAIDLSALEAVRSWPPQAFEPTVVDLSSIPEGDLPQQVIRICCKPDLKSHCMYA